MVATALITLGLWQMSLALNIFDSFLLAGATALTIAMIMKIKYEL